MRDSLARVILENIPLHRTFFKQNNVQLRTLENHIAYRERMEQTCLEQTHVETNNVEKAHLSGVSPEQQSSASAEKSVLQGSYQAPQADGRRVEISHRVILERADKFHLKLDHSQCDRVNGLYESLMEEQAGDHLGSHGFDDPTLDQAIYVTHRLENLTSVDHASRHLMLKIAMESREFRGKAGEVPVHVIQQDVVCELAQEDRKTAPSVTDFFDKDRLSRASTDSPRDKSRDDERFYQALTGKDEATALSSSLQAVNEIKKEISLSIDELEPAIEEKEKQRGGMERVNCCLFFFVLE